MKAAAGNNVKVHYTGTLDDETVFDSSRDRDPLEFTIGNGQLIKGFEDAVVGMAVGDLKTVGISSEEAYGNHRDELLINIDKKQFPENIDPVEGLQISLKSPEGKIVNASVTAVGESSVTLDANHPLAGKNLTFNIELVEIL
jgi:FKBP-type peptidyl-prolyl cis-trans isomerase 2